MHRTMNLLIEESDLLKMYCNHIVRNNKDGIYNGAYNAIKLAVSGKF